jgi:nucleoid-associated protein YgaU
MLVAAGCGRPVLRIADPSLGDYYTDEEFRRLRREQRDEYCAAMAQQDSSYLAAVADLRQTLAEVETRRTRLSAELDSLSAVREGLQSRLAASAGVPEGSAGYRVRPGDSLWKISARPGVYGDGRRWRRLHEANRAVIRDPDLIYPNQEIRIPR